MMEHAGEKTVAMQLRPASSSASLVRTTISTLGKDLRLEWHSKDALNAMLFFALLVLVVNGAFFAALSLRTRSRELMLPLLLFPISIPALLAMVSATSAILTGEDSPHSASSSWRFTI